MAAQDGAAFVLDPSASSTLTLQGSAVAAASDAAGGRLILAAGAAPFVLDTASAGGRPCLATTPGQHNTLLNTTFAPAAPAPWGALPWTFVGVVAADSVPYLGGGAIFGQEGQGAATLGVGGTAFGAGSDAGALADVFYATQQGVAVFRWPFTAPTPTGPMIVALSYDGARLTEMTNGGADPGNGVPATLAVTQPGFGLADGYGSGPASSARWCWGAWFSAALAPPTLRALERSLAVDYGMLAKTTRIVTVGDSLTRGDQSPTEVLPPDEAWPGVMQRQLLAMGLGVTVDNESISGSLASAWVDTGQAWYVNIRVPDTVLPADTWVLVLLEHNDIVFDDIDGAEAIRRLQVVLGQLTGFGYKVALLTLPDSLNFTPAEEQTKAELNAWILASPYLVIDVAALPDAQDPSDPKFFTDGTHLAPPLADDFGRLAASRLAPMLQ